MRNHYQEQLNERFRRTPVSGPPEPWLHLTTLMVGGMQAIGFSDSESHLLVITADGRGLFELPSGHLASRDRDQTGTWWELTNLRAQGLSPVAGEWIPLAGIHGGGLPHVTLDGWALDRVAPDWPNESVFLSEPGVSVFHQKPGSRVYNLGPTSDGDSIVAFGFSRSGTYFLIATSSEVELFGRVAASTE